MATNVFGTPVTNETLEGLPEFHEKIPTPIDRARVALEMKNAEGKDVNARKFAEAIQEGRPDSRCSAIVLIYNATGNPFTFRSQNHWSGRVDVSPIPNRIDNGQWGVFVHNRLGNREEARGGVIYTNQATNNQYYDWVLAWSTSTNGPTNQATGDIGRTGAFDGRWAQINTRLSSKPLYDYRSFDGLRVEVAIANSAITTVEAICTFHDLWGMPNT